MPRRLAAAAGALAAALVVQWTGPATLAQPTTVPPKTSLDAARNNRAIEHTVEGGSATVAEATPTRGTRRRSPVSNVFHATVPVMVVQEDGSRCIRNVRRAYPDALSATVAEDRENILWRLAAASFPLCPASPVPERVPAARAAEYWRVVGEDLLPKPSPRIAPGYMLAGKLAYLEAGTVPTARFEHPTPAGVLTIEATARHWVDWDDGSSLSGPFDHPGGPWPHGTITHYWIHVGHYDVRVIQRWTGRWILGTESGQLAGLETEGVIEDFPVEEVQAVINR